MRALAKLFFFAFLLLLPFRGWLLRFFGKKAFNIIHSANKTQYNRGSKAPKSRVWPRYSTSSSLTASATSLFSDYFFFFYWISPEAKEIGFCWESKVFLSKMQTGIWEIRRKGVVYRVLLWFSCLDIYSSEAKNRVFEFDYKKMNMFKSVPCSKISCSSLFENWLWASSSMILLAS